MNQILTDEECSKVLGYGDIPLKYVHLYLNGPRAIEAAILAKLNSAEPVPDQTMIECVAGAISKHISTSLYQREVIAAAQYIAHRYCSPAPSAANVSLTDEGKTNQVADFIYRFKRHVGGDGEFWLHELEDFYFGEVSARS